MRYIIASFATLSLFISGLVAVPAFAQTADDYGNGSTSGVICPNLVSTIQRGSRDATTGGQVSELQSFITDFYNLDDGVISGGFFGKLTQKYVVQFQKEQGLPSFGIVGQLTRAKIATLCNQTSTGTQSNTQINVQTTTNKTPNQSPSQSNTGPNTLVPSTNQSQTQAPTVSYINPTSAGVGATVNVFGTNFDSATFVGLDGAYGTAIQPSSITLISPTQLSFVLPSLSAGNHTIAVAEKAGPWNLSSSVTLNVASPLSAACHGSPYNSGTPGISWASTPSGGNGSYSYQWSLANDNTGTGISGTSADLQQQNLLATYGSTGTKNASVVISSASQSTTTTCSAIIGAPAPSVTNITPSSGSTNTTITLGGYNLSGATEVNFYHSNGQLGWTVPSSASNISISANSITITVSGGAVGVAGPDTYQVKVVTPSGTSNAQTFTLTAPSNTAPILNSVSPTSGSTNTNVTLYGSNLSSATEVDFYHSNGQLGSTIPASNITISANSISFTISGGMVGIAGPDTYQVKVVTPNGTSNAQALTITQ